MLQPGEKLFKPTFQGIFLKFRAAFDIGQKGHFFMKKGHQKSPPPTTYSIPFLSVLHQNKDLSNFRKRGQRSIVERNIGLEYALPSFVLLLY